MTQPVNNDLRPAAVRAEEVYEQRSIGELLAKLSRDGSDLLSRELDLAKTEVGVQLNRAKRDLAVAAVGGAVVYAGVLALLAAIVLGLSNLMAPWVAALIVGVVTIVVGAVALQQGLKDASRTNAMPNATAKNLQRDYQMVKESMR